MRFLADENLPLPSVMRLRDAGHDVAAVMVDSPGADDYQALRRAASEARIVLTFDRDFGRLLFHATLAPPLGVVYLRFQPSTPEEPADPLLRLLAEGRISLEGRFTVVDSTQVRQRPLP